MTPEPWIQTASGRRYPLLDPQPSDFHIEDIAKALSHVCRFSGHCKTFYSVAQHSVLCSLFVGDSNQALAALLHDATEAYLADISSPLKHSYVMKEYRFLEKRTEKVLAERFGLPFPMPPCIKEVDNRMLLTERNNLLGEVLERWGVEIEAKPFDYVIEPWSSQRAEYEFLCRYETLGGD